LVLKKKDILSVLTLKKNRGSGFASLEQVLGQIIHSHGLERRLAEGNLLSRWPQSVGEKIAGVTEAIDLKDGRLFVKVTSAAWRSELVLLKPGILEKLNKMAGKKLITDIVFI
jgi:predicted nucleic acid-binding Zn ribbon protein